MIRLLLWVSGAGQTPIRAMIRSRGLLVLAAGADAVLVVARFLIHALPADAGRGIRIPSLRVRGPVAGAALVGPAGMSARPPVLRGLALLELTDLVLVGLVPVRFLACHGASPRWEWAGLAMEACRLVSDPPDAIRLRLPSGGIPAVSPPPDRTAGLSGQRSFRLRLTPGSGLARLPA